MRKQKTHNIKNIIVNKLRMIWRYYSPERRKALDGAKRERNGVTSYKCNSCKKYYSKDNVNVDHVESVRGGEFSTAGKELHEVDWTGIITRMFLGKQQVLCKKCHDRKTEEERAGRRKRKN